MRDILPGIDSSYVRYLTAVNEILFFTAYDEAHGIELWKSDGTPDGTHLVKDIVTGTGSSGTQGSDRRFVNNNGMLFFTANHPDTGVELWRSDGTDAGTQLVADIAPGVQGSSISELVAMDGWVYFTAVTAATALLVTGATAAHGQAETARAVEGGGISVEGWTGRIDARVAKLRRGVGEIVPLIDPLELRPVSLELLRPHGERRACDAGLLVVLQREAVELEVVVVDLRDGVQHEPLLGEQVVAAGQLVRLQQLLLALRRLRRLPRPGERPSDGD